jgi:hypothetical protein
VRAGATRLQHHLRQLALLTILGRPPRFAVGVAGRGHRPMAETLAELSWRRRRAQIAARRALRAAAV